MQRDRFKALVVEMLDDYLEDQPAEATAEELKAGFVEYLGAATINIDAPDEGEEVRPS